MKYRNGFVSNSSSSCFILDMRKPLVKELIETCNTVVMEDGTEHAILSARDEALGRQTSIAIGKQAKWYADEWCDEVTWWGEDYRGLGHWILEWYEKLGENLVFIRESDEGMGGHLPVKLGVLEALAEDEMEYH